METKIINMKEYWENIYWKECNLPNLEVEIKESYCYEAIEITFKQNNDNVSTFKFKSIEDNKKLLDLCNEITYLTITDIYLITDIVIDQRYFDMKKMEGLFNFTCIVAEQHVSTVIDEIIINTKLLDKFPKDSIKTIFLLDSIKINFENQEYFQCILNPIIDLVD